MSKPHTIADTSIAALDAHEASGKLRGNLKLLFDAVREAPQLTSAEYAVWLQHEGHCINRHEAASRLADLKRKKLVRQVGKRKCTTGHKREAVTWDVAEPPEEKQGELFSTEAQYT